MKLADQCVSISKIFQNTGIYLYFYVNIVKINKLTERK